MANARRYGSVRWRGREPLSRRRCNNWSTGWVGKWARNAFQAAAVGVGAGSDVISGGGAADAVCGSGSRRCRSTAPARSCRRNAGSTNWGAPESCASNRRSARRDLSAHTRACCLRDSRDSRLDGAATNATRLRRKVPEHRRFHASHTPVRALPDGRVDVSGPPDRQVDTTKWEGAVQGNEGWRKVIREYGFSVAESHEMALRLSSILSERQGTSIRCTHRGASVERVVSCRHLPQHRPVLHSSLHGSTLALWHPPAAAFGRESARCAGPPAVREPRRGAPCLPPLPAACLHRPLGPIAGEHTDNRSGTSYLGRYATRHLLGVDGGVRGPDSPGSGEAPRVAASPRQL
eukprot:ctg_311.g226